MHIAILTFDGFNEIDSFVALNILNRVKRPHWRASIASPTPRVRSMNGVVVEAQASLADAANADAVIIGSGRKTRDVVADPALMAQLRFDPARQLLGAQCSGTLVLAKLGLLDGVPACTDTITKTHRKAPAKKAIAAATIVVIEDDVLVAESLRDMLADDKWTVDVCESAEAFFKVYRPGYGDCLLIDVHLPGASGIDVLKRLQRDGSPASSIMITGAGDVETAVEVMKSGAVDFIEKPVHRKDLVAAVKRVIERAKDTTKATAWQKAAADRIASLTPRQREIMERVLAGEPSKNIAADLSLSQRTVENHRARIMKRTGAKSLPALARLGLVATLSGKQIIPKPTEIGDKPANVEAVMAMPDLANVLESDQFKRFFDQIPMAIVVAVLKSPERIVYANPAFEQLSGQTLAEVIEKPWESVRGQSRDPQKVCSLAAAVTGSADFVGTFQLERAKAEAVMVDVYSNIILDDDDSPIFRLAAMVDVSADDVLQRQEFEQKIREKDTLLLEIQHRVKNNLQMVTALIRVEARTARGKIDTAPFDRLAGRINAVQILYDLLSNIKECDEIDLGTYLSEIASSVMHAHAVEGIRLDLKVDSYPVSVNVALPTGLVANELLTNALKHAFVGREGGTITLHSLSDSNGCRVTIADDGIGLPPGVEWPKHGKLGELIVRSLRQNAKANLSVDSQPGKGMRVVIGFTRAAAAPDVVVNDSLGVTTA